MSKPKKAHKIENTNIIVHSFLATMNPAEKAEWFQAEWDKGNSVLKEIARAVENCYRKV